MRISDKLGYKRLPLTHEEIEANYQEWRKKLRRQTMFIYGLLVVAFAGFFLSYALVITRAFSR